MLFSKMFKSLSKAFGTILNTFRSWINSFMESLKIFDKPHHSSTLSLRGLSHSVVATVIVGLLSLILKPFGLDGLVQAEFMNVWITICGITFGIMVLAQFILPLIIKDFYSENKWTTGKQLAQFLIMSLLISLSTVLYLSSKGLASFPLDALTIFGLSIIPLGILAIVQQNLLSSKFERLALEKNEAIQRKSVVNSENPLHVLTFKGSTDVLNLIPNQLIYIKLGTTPEFYYQNMLGVEKSSLRISNEIILKELLGHPQFELFGKDFIVNVNGIEKISGTARGYDIQIARINEMVKISHKDKKKIDKL